MFGKPSAADLSHKDSLTVTNADPIPDTDVAPIPPVKTSVKPAAEPKGVFGFVLLQVVGTVVCVGSVPIINSDSTVVEFAWLVPVIYGIVVAKVVLAAAATVFGP